MRVTPTSKDEWDGTERRADYIQLAEYHKEMQDFRESVDVLTTVVRDAPTRAQLEASKNEFRKLLLRIAGLLALMFLMLLLWGVTQVGKIVGILKSDHAGIRSDSNVVTCSLQQDLPLTDEKLAACRALFPIKEAD